MSRESYYSKRITRIQQRMKVLEAKHPGINLKDSDLRVDIENYFNLMRSLIYAQVDMEYCASDDRRNKCSECNCWKSQITHA